MGFFSDFFGALFVGAIFAVAVTFTGGTAFGLAPQFFNVAFFKVAAISAGIGLASRLLTPEPDIGGLGGGGDPTNVGAQARSAISAARWRFGTIATGANPVWIEDEDPWTLHVIYPLSSGEIDSIHSVWSDTHGKLIPFVRGVIGYTGRQNYATSRQVIRGSLLRTVIRKAFGITRWHQFGPFYYSNEGGGWNRGTVCVGATDVQVTW